uniref:Uncharacterized protein n=1 Tax=Myoviridae sp. ctijX18 TaxID=2825154 RepID=A0A8S5USK4_9CAUD|nr:MAG TPA: hypothetical protein [Myoviridae sp. ctijX18]DAJ69055.1 MAG TPA: hypothetical protein [Caudoviricetes sp.]DAR99725.1 MAG TPA: hypothetical protein [Caudoviricetes sp.]DAY25357.1 MAG TPA: hypothetical protein [Caudoviricetes sp.]
MSFLYSLVRVIVIKATRLTKLTAGSGGALWCTAWVSCIISRSDLLVY